MRVVGITLKIAVVLLALVAMHSAGCKRSRSSSSAGSAPAAVNYEARTTSPVATVASARPAMAVEEAEAAVPK